MCWAAGWARKDKTEVAEPDGCWLCDGWTGVSHTVAPRHSSTLHCGIRLAALWSRRVREYDPQ